MPVKREAESEMSVATRDLERYQAMSERLGLKVDHPWTMDMSKPYLHSFGLLLQ